MRSQLYSLSSVGQHRRPASPHNFDAKWIRSGLRIPWICSRKTHPLNCPVSDPREVLRADSKAHQQRQAPEQERFDHGYSTRTEGSPLEIDEIRHRRTGRKSSVVCHVVLVRSPTPPSFGCLLTPTRTKVYPEGSHHPLPRHARRRRRGRPAPHARFACAEPGGKFAYQLWTHVLDISDVPGWQIMPPSRVPAPSRRTTAYASLRIPGVSEGIQHASPDISDSKTLTMVSNACCRCEG